VNLKFEEILTEPLYFDIMAENPIAISDMHIHGVMPLKSNDSKTIQKVSITALEYAYLKDNQILVEKLLCLGAKAAETTLHLLHIVSAGGNENIEKSLLSAPVDCLARDAAGRTPFMSQPFFW
jgi:hypothetical protein